ncbi:uncharacterized protein N7483_007661 [Penicillium malachiteum]|uniref:uncharacterized protein n=1 Tax=Penicillium malachiteum TaxID=1324776 RepID=UPI002548C5BC|nr:uncharacterized protein N7483_007661 [Penicillium malachiteum]KAJ5726304.1 hypothetical protein N7483_007661 [Penicillium malachiteum]
MVSSLLQKGSLLLPILGHILPTVATSVPVVSCSINQPQLFTNPSFEDGTWDGWTVTDSAADASVVDSDSSSSVFTTAADGEYYIDTHSTQLRGSDALFLRQTLDELDTSMTYTISFSMAAVAPTSTQYCYIYVFKDAQENADLLEEFQVTIGTSGLPWTEYSLEFQPTSESHLILFLPECTGSTHVGFDNFQFLQPATTLCSTSYSTVPAVSSTQSNSIVSSQVVSPTSVASSEPASSSVALSSSASPVSSSIALASQTVIASSSHVPSSSQSFASSSATTQRSSAAVKSSSSLVPVATSQSSVVISVSQVRSASHTPSARASSQLVSVSLPSSHHSSAPRSSPIAHAKTVASSSPASTGAHSSSSSSSFNTPPAASTSSSIFSFASLSASSSTASVASSDLPTISTSSSTVNPVPAATSDASASSSETTPSDSSTQTEITPSQSTGASESGYTIISNPTSTESSGDNGNGNGGETVTGTSYSTTPAQVGDAETSSVTHPASQWISSSTVVVTETVTLAWPSGHAVTKTIYQTVVECPEDEQTTSASSAPTTMSTEDGGSDTAPATLSTDAAFVTAFSGISASSSSSEESSSSASSDIPESENSTNVSEPVSSSRPLHIAAHTFGLTHSSSHYAVGSFKSTQAVTTSSSASSTTTPIGAVYTGFGTRMENQSTFAIVVIIAVLVFGDLL